MTITTQPIGNPKSLGLKRIRKPGSSGFSSGMPNKRARYASRSKKSALSGLKAFQKHTIPEGLDRELKKHSNKKSLVVAAQRRTGKRNAVLASHVKFNNNAKSAAAQSNNVKKAAAVANKNAKYVAAQVKQTPAPALASKKYKGKYIGPDKYKGVIPKHLRHKYKGKYFGKESGRGRSS